ncbi:hypothetical protein BaRGS_00024561, partial [Batillaria attramentaria]
MQSTGSVSHLDSFRQEWHDSLTSAPEYCLYHSEIMRANHIAEPARATNRSIMSSTTHRQALKQHKDTEIRRKTQSPRPAAS